MEYAHFSSDVYSATENGPVVRVSKGVAEHRFRIGFDARISSCTDLYVDLQAFGERVSNADFIEGSSRFNGGLLLTLSWIPARLILR